MKATHLEGLKIPVSAVRFRSRAPIFTSGSGENACSSRSLSSPRIALSVPAGCQRVTRSIRALTLLVFAALAASLTACATPVATWHGDARFTPEERASIEGGEGWLAEHAGREPSTFDWAYDVTSDEPLPHTVRRERGPDGTGQCVGGIGGAVYLGIDVGTPTRPIDVLGWAAHELAHCELGFVDDPKTDGLMRVVTPPRWTEREQAQCAEHPDLCHASP